MENNNVSDGESPGECLNPVHSPICPGRLTRHWAAESVSAVMCASVALNWLQIKT
jgi:hypothetical protein